MSDREDGAPPATGRARGLAAWGAGLALAAVLGSGLAYRLAVVADWRAPAGDGVQYYELSQELARRQRLAYGRKGLLAHTRLPGYPLFLAYVAVRKVPVKLQEHLVRATRWNAYLDVATGLLLFLLLRERRLGLASGLLAAVGVIVCPLMLILSTYGLTESLATFLTTLAVLLACRAMRTRPLLHAALAGAVIGLLQLTRPDGVAVVPAVGLAILLATTSARRRLAALALCAATAALVFAPWPIRNLRHFKAAHPVGTHWVAQAGHPLPTGFLEWMSTWSRGDPGEERLLYLLARGRPIGPNQPGLLLPTMYDSPAERLRVAELFARYNLIHLSPDVDAGFRALARERAKRAPLRTWVGVPLLRMRAMWRPLPEYDFPVKSKVLGLPQRRAEHGDWDRRLLGLATVGLLVLLAFRRRSDGAATAAVLVTAIAANSLVHVYGHPTPVQRYVVYIYPLLIGLAAFGLATVLRAPLELAHRLAARRRGGNGTSPLPARPA